MSGLEITVDLDSAELERALARAIANAADLSRPMLKIAVAMHEATVERFDQERDPLGVPWRKSRRAVEDGGKTLQASGDLKHAIVAESGNDFAVVGVNTQGSLFYKDRSVMDYAAIHQFGGTTARRRKGHCRSAAASFHRLSCRRGLFWASARARNRKSSISSLRTYVACSQEMVRGEGRCNGPLRCNAAARETDRSA